MEQRNQRAIYYPRGYVAPSKTGGTLTTMSGVIIGGAIGGVERFPKTEGILADLNPNRQERPDWTSALLAVAAIMLLAGMAAHYLIGGAEFSNRNGLGLGEGLGVLLAYCQNEPVLSIVVMGCCLVATFTFVAGDAIGELLSDGLTHQDHNNHDH